MEQGSEMSGLSSQTIPVDAPETRVDAPGARVDAPGARVERAPAPAVMHDLKPDDPRCTCGLPREECVRLRVRALWTV